MLKKTLNKIDSLRVWALSNPWILVLMLLPFFRPPEVLEYLTETIGTPWRIFYFLYRAILVLCIGAFFLARPKLSPFTILLYVYYGLVMVITYFSPYGEDLLEWADGPAQVIISCLLLELAINTDIKAFLKALLYLMGVELIINLISIFMTYAGVGMYVDTPGHYFMGLDNSHPFFIVPFLTIMMLCLWKAPRHRFILQTVLLAVFSLSIYITWSAAGQVCVSVFILLFFLLHIKNSDKLLNICTYYAGAMAIFILLAVLRVTDRFSFLIEDLLHKGLTLSGRTYIWENTLELFLEHPLFGVGALSQATSGEMIGAMNCHNFFWQVPLQAGVVGAVVYAAMMGTVIRPLMRTKNTFGGAILAVGIFAFLIELQAESLIWPVPFYTLLLLAYNAEKVVAAMGPGPETLPAAPSA